ncbi:MAG: hypothetical protein H0X34_03045 [Chthoniobacterales bacterium]|nr:hypothetical protein [Chthoniobacterales bacterium]
MKKHLLLWPFAAAKNNKRSAACRLLQAVGLTCLFAAHSAVAQVASTWTGGVGDYVDAGFWSNGVPNGDSADAFIDGGKTGIASSVGINNQFLKVGRLTLDSGDTLSIAPGYLFFVQSGSFAGSGSIINNGTFNLDSTTNNTTLSFVGGPSNLSGTGTLNLTSLPGNTARITNDSLLTIGAGQTVAGSGEIGLVTGDLINNGTINANQNGRTLTLAPGLNFTSGATGVNEATNGGILNLGFGNYNGGTYQAFAGSQVTIAGNNDSPTFIGVTLAGVVAQLGTPTLTNVTNNGTITASGPFTTLAGTFTNNGIFTFLTNSGSISISSDTSVSGTGKITLVGGDNGIFVGPGGLGARLTIGVGQTIEGAGFLGDGNLTFTNNGTVNANLNGQVLALSPGGGNGSDFTNGKTGVIESTNGGIIGMAGGPFVNAGGLVSATVNATDSFTQTSGTIDLSGGDITVSLGLDLNGGILEGTGKIIGDLRNTSGDLAPGHSAGTVTVTGAYTQGTKGLLDMQLGGAPSSTANDKVVVSGQVTLTGTLNVTLINGFKPSAGDVYTLIKATSVTGSFSTITLNGFTGQVDYSSNGVTLTITSGAPQLLNISTRLKVLAGDNVLIGGFIVTGSESKKVILRAIGPSLTKAGVTGALADPVLELHKPDGTVVTNDNWKGTQEAAIIATGVAPTNDLESAIVATLAPGNYTAVVHGKNNGTGIGLVEAFDLNQAASSELANISTRGFVDTGDNVMIGGFIIGGGTAGTNATVLVRAIGPSLTKAGVAGALQDPKLELHDANGNLLKSNDNWKSTQKAAIIASGVPPSNDKESAIIDTLAPGNYTAIVRGKSSTTGVALVEVYNLP